MLHNIKTFCKKNDLIDKFLPCSQVHFDFNLSLTEREFFIKHHLQLFIYACLAIFFACSFA